MTAFPKTVAVPCKVNSPLCGSFNIVFTIEFADGLKWMLETFVNGDHFIVLDAEAIMSEAWTPMMIRSATSIPVPKVYAVDTSVTNALNAPFILMERLEGTPLYEGWFNAVTQRASLEHFRAKTLHSIAALMA